MKPGVHEFNLFRDEDAYHCAVALFPASDYAELEATKESFFHASELKVFLRFKHENRKRSFLLGRYAAKQALAKLCGEEDLRAIQVIKGIFGQPVVKYKSSLWDVSISHCAEWAVALAFPLVHPMGLDIETVDLGRINAMKSQFTLDENQWVRSKGPDFESTLSTVVWTVKEGISKLIKSGFMSPFSIYELDLKKLEATQPSMYVNYFRNFGQYKAVSLVSERHVLSLVLPKLSTLAGKRWQDFIQ